MSLPMCLPLAFRGIHSLKLMSASLLSSRKRFSCAYQTTSIAFQFQEMTQRRYKSGQGSVSSVLTVGTARDLIAQLSPKERVLLLEEMQTFQAAAAKDEPSPPPSVQQLRAVLMHNALPFIGFGFLDNFIMILAGDYIDTTIGITLGISTMAAAALGNLISDIAGISSAWYIESFSWRLGFPPPVLTPAQIDMVRTRWSANLGRALGITVGCLLGMIPLLFISEKSRDKSTRNNNSNCQQ